MSISKKQHELQLQAWHRVILNQQSSGMSATAWCTANDISKSKFFYWKRALKEIYLDSQLPEIVPLAFNSPTTGSETLNPRSESYATFNPQSESSKTFNPVCFGQGISLIMDDVSLCIGESASVALITKVIKAVRNAK